MRDNVWRTLTTVVGLRKTEVSLPAGGGLLQSKLLARETLEVGHLARHFFADGEVVRVDWESRWRGLESTRSRIEEVVSG